MSVPRRLAAILSADVVGYSRLMGADEAGTLERLKALRKDLFAPKIAEHNGRVVKLMGDGALVEFASVVDAVQCAVALQRALAGRGGETPADRRIDLRIGVNLGDVIIEGSDIYGDGVNVAARVQELAAPGGVALSATAYEHVEAKIDVGFEDGGVHELKNIARPVRIYHWSGGGAVRQPVKDTPPHSDKPSIAVLPFTNMSGDAEQEYFSDGITEDIITTLSKIPGLAVIARNSTFAYKGQSVSVKDVAAELGVRYVLEGSVRRAGDRMRITAQLIDAADASHLWAERYDRNVEDIFEVQDEITRHIVVALQAELVVGDYADLWQGGSKNFEAWQLKARGVHEFLKFTKEGMLKSRELVEKALALEPDDEVAMASLGHSHDQLASSNWIPDPEAGFAKAQEMGERILAANPDSAPGHVLLASIQRSRRQFDDAVVNAERALELAPNDSINQAFLAATLIAADRPGDSVEHIESAIRLNPNYPNWFGSTRVQAYRMTGRADRALEAAAELTQRHPEYVRGLALMAAVLVENGMVEEAQRAAQAVLERDPEFTISHYLNEFKLKSASRRKNLAAALRKAGLDV